MSSQRDEESQETTEHLLQSSESNNHNANNGVTGNQSKVSFLEKVVSQGERGAALLVKHLPIGNALLFEFFSPIPPGRVECKLSSKIRTLILISLCAISSAIFTFSDSFRDSQNKLRFGIATFHGLVTLDGISQPSDPSEYKINGSDFVHVITTVLLFLVVVLFNKPVVEFFFGKISDAFILAPVIIWICGCGLLLMYPSKRNGARFPLFYLLLLLLLLLYLIYLNF